MSRAAGKANPPMTIELHTWNTPNGRKISVALEEMGMPYTVKPVNIGKGEQFAAGFVKISPNSKIPAIVDPEAPGGAPINRATVCFSMYSLMSILIMAFSSSNKNSASARDNSVLPTPVGPRKRNEPIGRFGSCKPARARRTALATALIASS